MKKLSKITYFILLIVLMINIICIHTVKAEGSQTNIQGVHTSEEFKDYSQVSINCKRARNDTKTTLTIESHSDLWWSYDTRQAIDIKITSLVNDKESDWIRLGEGIYGYAFNQTYTYEVNDDENYGDKFKVTVRCVSWWVGQSETELLSTEKNVDINDTAIIKIGRIYILSPNNTTTLEVGNTLDLSVDFIEILDEPITWESSDESIATVDQNGKVTAKKIGTVTIKAYTQNKEYTDEYELEIVDGNNTEEYDISLVNLVMGAFGNVAVTDSTIWLNRNGDTNSSPDGTSYYLNLTKKNTRKIIEQNLNLNNLTIQSSNDKVLKGEIKDGKVLVRGISEGKADLTLTYKYNGKIYTNKTNWIVRPNPTPYFVVRYPVAVLLDNSIVELDAQNKSNTKDVSVYFSTLTTDITAYPDGYNENNYFICNWKSLNESIVKINGASNIKTAKLEAVSAGKAEVQCIVKTADGNETITKTVTVYVKGDTRIGSGSIKISASNDQSKIKTGETLQLSTNNGAESSSAMVTWESSDSSIATVDSNGKVTAKKAGTVKIIAYTVDKKYSDEYEIVVSDNTPVNPSEDSNNKKSDENNKKTDGTTANSEIPQTGAFSKIAIIISLVIIVGVIGMVKYRKSI